MRQKQSHSESHGKDGATAERPLTKAEAKKAMAKFESLTRGLLKVTPAQLSQEEQNWRKRKERENNQ